NLAAMNAEGVYWLSRMSMQVQIIDERTGKEIDLPAFLARQVADEIDMYVLAGKVERMRCRLLGVRVPPEVAAERRRKMLANGRDRCRPIKPRRLLLADWALLLTNVPPDMLSLPEAQALYRARWQIEMLFKLWKSYGKLARWRSRKPMRILCEVYAKLLAMLVQHWILIASCWAYPDRSLAKASATIRRSAMAIVWALDHPGRLRSALRSIRDCLTSGCRINKRRKAPATNQLLASPASLRPATAMVA
ncbi:MAG: transposase, partial [Chloroflexi bacterium]|nr:transposase [Chloroflexota bacterium]